MTASMWNYAQDPSDWADNRLIGYKVEATDGSIGKIHEASTETDAQSLVVDTSTVPLFGQKVMLPAGTIQRVDHDDQKVYVSCTKDQIKDSPEYDDTLREDTNYRDKLGGYYQGFPR